VTSEDVDAAYLVTVPTIAECIVECVQRKAGPIRRGQRVRDIDNQHGPVLSEQVETSGRGWRGGVSKIRAPQVIHHRVSGKQNAQIGLVQVPAQTDVVDRLFGRAAFGAATAARQRVQLELIGSRQRRRLGHTHVVDDRSVDVREAALPDNGEHIVWIQLRDTVVVGDDQVVVSLRGIGSAIITFLESEARIRGCRAAWLATDKAEDFFLRLAYIRGERSELPAPMQTALAPGDVSGITRCPT